MSLIKEYFYNIECDRCGDKLDPKFWHDEVSTLEAIMSDCGWIEHNGKHYCPDCYEIDDAGKPIFQITLLDNNQ